MLTRGIQREHCHGSNVWLLFPLVVRETNAWWFSYPW